MVRTIVSMAAMAAFGAMQLVAQPHSGSPLEDLLRPHGHARPPRVAAVPSPAVVFDAGSLGSPIVLDKGWRVGITANPAASQPDFDDSTWAVRDAKEFISDVPDEDHPADSAGSPPNEDKPASGTRPAHHRPFVWFRIHVKLAPNHGPVALFMELPVSQNTTMVLGSTGPPVDVFANGKEINPEGPHGDALEHYQQISRIYNLDVPASETSLTLAVRTIYIPFGFAAYTGFFSNRKLHLGNRDDLGRSLELWSIHGLLERIPRLVNSILLIVLALFLLALYFSQKGHTEYLWLAMYELLQAPIGFVELAGSSARLDSLWYAAAFFSWFRFRLISILSS